MILQAIVIGVSAAALLLIAGYLSGVRRGYQARERLRQQNLQQAEELLRLQKQPMPQQNDPGLERLRIEFGKMIEPLLQQNEAVQQVLTPLMQQVLTPLMHRERLGLALANLSTGSGHRYDLIRLVNQIAESGNFATVLLSDEEGLPLAASKNAKDLDRLAALSSLALLLADRIGRDNAPTLRSVIIHDEMNELTLCRIFRVGGQRLLLTGVSTDAQLAPTALDPALAKLDTVLSSET